MHVTFAKCNFGHCWHGMVVLRPDTGQKLFFGHGIGVVMLLNGQKCPGVHWVYDVSPVVGQNWPGWHVDGRLYPEVEQ